MLKASFLFFSLLVCTVVFCQSFEGKLIYNNSYKSKIASVPDDQFNTMMGTKQVYLIKGGNYKSTMDGTMMQWQLYRSADNKLYMKMATSPVVYWNDGAVNPDEVQEARVNKAVKTILGYSCDELVLTCKSGVQKYYFSSRLKVDPKLFEKHKFGNWSEVLRHTKSLPLKTIVETPQFVLESTAVEVSDQKVDDKEFQLPPNVELQKSPF